MRYGLLSALLALMGSGFALAQTPLSDILQATPPKPAAPAAVGMTPAAAVDAQPAAPVWRTTAQAPVATLPVDLSPKADAPKSGEAAGKTSTQVVEEEPSCGPGVLADCNKKQTNLCCPPGCAWASAEYLLWNLRPAPLSGVGSAFPIPGDLNLGWASGINAMAGVQSEDHRIGLEAGFFILEQRSASIAATAATLPGIPVPGPFTAGVVGSNRLWGGEINLTKAGFGAVGKKSSWEIDFLGGLRYANLSEALNSNIAAGTAVTANSNFSTQNNFYGPQVGTLMEYRYGKAFVLTTAKVALGYVHQTASANAVASVAGAGSAATTGGGTADDFAVIPQVGITFGYQINQRVRLFAGYQYFYWNNVARPGSQVGPGLAPTPGGSGLSAPSVQQSEFWAHGLTAGVAFHF